MISERLKKTILKELRLKDFLLDEHVRAYEVPGWDSLSHIKIICAIEKEYKTQFGMKDLLALNELGDLQALVDKTVPLSAKTENK